MVAARRVAGLAKYLARDGHRVTILTSAVWGQGAIEGATRVVRTGDLLASPLNWRGRSLRSVSGQGGSTYAARSSLLSRIVVPDIAAVTWTPFALRAALRLARRDHFDCVLTTSPPESVHVVGIALQRRGVPWVADLRDGWGFEPTHDDWLVGAQRKLGAALERSALGRADIVTTVTEPISADARSRLGVDAVTVTNGFDPDELRDEREQPQVDALSHERFSIVHTGRMTAGGVGPTLGPLLAGLSRLAVRDPQIGSRVELVFVGPLTEPEKAMIDSAEPAGCVRSIGSVDRSAAVELQRAADVLVVLAGSARPSVATGKLYEYLAADRPILVLGNRTEAARIVTETGSGLAVAPDDVEAIASALGELVAAGHGRRRGPEAIERYSYRALAGQLEAAVEAAISKHGCG